MSPYLAPAGSRSNYSLWSAPENATVRRSGPGVDHVVDGRQGVRVHPNTGASDRVVRGGGTRKEEDGWKFIL